MVDLRTGDACRLLKELPSESIDLCLFSPPYDNIRTYSGTYSFDYQRLGKRLFRVMKPGGVCAVVIGDGTVKGCKTVTSFRFPVYWCDAVGWSLWDTLIYNRTSAFNHHNRFRIDHEYIHLFVKGYKPRYFDKEPLKIPSQNAGKLRNKVVRNVDGSKSEYKVRPVLAMKCRGSVWTTSNTTRGRIKAEHPATFPDQLARDIIVCFSKEGDTVLDPYTGSGTTCVQSYILGRKSIGFDISADYINLAWRRVARECINDRFMEWVYEQNSARSSGNTF